MIFAVLFVSLGLAAQAQVAGLVAAEAPGPETSTAAARTEPQNLEAPPPVSPATLTPMQRGDILMAHKRYREAIDTYQEGLHRLAVMYNKIGIAYHQLADYRAALENYKRALAIDPTYAEVINNVGVVYYAQRDYGRAIRQYESALKHSPNSASFHGNLGTAYFARKKYDKALESYKTALDLDPNVFDGGSPGGAGSVLQQRSVEERAKFYYYMAKSSAEVGLTDRALLYIRKALEDGFRDKDRFQKDPEFAALQEMEEFKALMAMEPRVL
jgi:tetratricopeptide (TPR) repeat protein